MVLPPCTGRERRCCPAQDSLPAGKKTKRKGYAPGGQGSGALFRFPGKTKGTLSRVTRSDGVPLLAVISGPADQPFLF
jgi:hypothetical protein